MRRLHLGRGTELAELCGEHLDLEVASPAEAVRALMMEHPGAREIIERGEWRLRDGDQWATKEVDFLTTREASAIYLVPAAEGGNEGIGKIFAGIFIGIFGLLTGGGFLLGLGLSSSTYLGVATLLVLGGVSRLLAPTPLANPMALEESGHRQSSMFANPSTLSQQGEPVPIVYGTCRTGGLRASILIRNERVLEWGNTGDLVSLARISVIDILSEGTITGISGDKAGILLDGVPLDTVGGGDSMPGVSYEVFDGGSAAAVVGHTAKPTRVGKLVSDVNPVVLRIESPETTSAIITLVWNQLFFSDSTTPPEPTTVEFEVDISAGGGAYVPLEGPLSTALIPTTGTYTLLNGNTIDYLWTWSAGDPDPWHASLIVNSPSVSYPEIYEARARVVWIERTASSSPPTNSQLYLYFDESALTNNPFSFSRFVQYPSTGSAPWTLSSTNGSIWEWIIEVDMPLVEPFVPSHGTHFTDLNIYTDHGPGFGTAPNHRMMITTVEIGIGEGTVTGRALSPYAQDVSTGALSAYGAAPWDIRVTRTTPDLAADSLSRDQFQVANFQEIIEDTLDYPDSALIAIEGDSDAFGNTTPAFSYIVEGIEVHIPTGYDPAAGTFTSPWNGAFQINKAHTDDPAWLLYDLLTSDRYGLGIDPARIDKWSFGTASRRNLTTVEDLVTSGTTERRYTWNGAFTRAEEAFKVATQLAAVMDAQLWIAGDGQIYLGQDAPGSITRLIAQHNVVDGVFTYEGTNVEARRTSAVTSFRNKAQLYDVDVARDDRPHGLDRYGDNAIEIEAPGVTSYGQAVRRVRHLLITDEVENQTVKFKIGLENALIYPGQIIQISDSHREEVRLGVRIASSLWLGGGQLWILPENAGDWAAAFAGGSTYLRWTDEDGAVHGNAVALLYLGIAILTGVPTAVGSAVIPEGAPCVLTTVSPSNWRVIEITDDGEGIFSVLAVQHDEYKWTAIENPTDIGTAYTFPTDPWPPT